MSLCVRVCVCLPKQCFDGLVVYVVCRPLQQASFKPILTDKLAGSSAGFTGSFIKCWRFDLEIWADKLLKSREGRDWNSNRWRNNLLFYLQRKKVIFLYESRWRSVGKVGVRQFHLHRWINLKGGTFFCFAAIFWCRSNIPSATVWWHLHHHNYCCGSHISSIFHQVNSNRSSSDLWEFCVACVWHALFDDLPVHSQGRVSDWMTQPS